MREHRPIIALDFPSFGGGQGIFSSFPSRRKPLSQGRDGALLRSGPEIVSYLKGLGHSVFWISNFMTFLIQSSQP